MKETMGQIIRRLRKERNLTQEELSELLGVTSQAVSKWENDVGMPDISQVVPIAHVLGVTTDILFGNACVNGDEQVESFIREVEIRISNKPEEGISRFMHRKSCCEELQSELAVYPNNYKLYCFIASSTFPISLYTTARYLPRFSVNFIACSSALL